MSSEAELGDDGGDFGSVIHLVVSWAPLLSGALDECFTPDDESCQGGVAAVAAYLRHYNSRGQPSIVLPFFDKESPFVQMHPLGWSVNRLVLRHIMGFDVFGSGPSLLSSQVILSNKRPILDLQSKEMPLLLTNAVIPPSNSWFPFSTPVYFDESTGLALLLVFNSNDPLNAPQLESVAGVLNYVARVSGESGCSGDEWEDLFDLYINKTADVNKTAKEQQGSNTRRCWVPVVLYADVRENFLPFVEKAVELENPPALVIDLEGGVAPFNTVPSKVGPRGVWVVSHEKKSDAYLQHTIKLSADRNEIVNVELVLDDLTALNSTLKDEQYAKDIRALRQQADEAFENDPVVGQSTSMPFTRDGNIRRCKAGECEVGNLFTDAARWYTDADISFTSSGGLRGPGWPAGDVHISDIWGALPFSNSICSGVMTGVSMFNLFNYSINVATFEGENTSDGDRLLQVSGMRVTYNTELEGSRLVAMEVWDKQEEQYTPVERLKLYKFVTDNWVCGGFDPFPLLLGEESLVLHGEEPGTISDGLLYQTIVGNYLGQLDEPYVTGIEGRLVNDTSVTVSLNLVQSPDSCSPGTYWKEDVFTCDTCPDTSSVTFLRENVQFESEMGSDALLSGTIVMINGEIYDVVVLPKSTPSWLAFTKAEIESTGASNADVDHVASILQPGDQVTLYFDVNPGKLESGTAQGTVAFAVLGGGSYPACTGRDATFEALIRVTPQQQLNQLGSIRLVGFALSGVVVFTAMFFACWVIWNRRLRLVKTLQPSFLVMICCGVFILGASMIPLGIDDEIATDRGCDIACMAGPWLLSMGFTVAMSALFSKLWRINKLFRNAGLRRMKVQEKDVIGPFAVLFMLNFAFLLVWTLVEPMRWVRLEVSGEPWNTFGACRSSGEKNGPVTKAMMVSVAAVNIITLIASGLQAYYARNISDEFSESKQYGIALFSWFQIFLVGLPVLYLIDDDNPTARYFLEIILVFAVCMSMLLLIFLPMIIYNRRANRAANRSARNVISANDSSHFSVKQIGKTRVSGLNFGGQSFEQLSHELGKLDFQEHVPVGDDPSRRLQILSASYDLGEESSAAMNARSNGGFSVMESLVEDSGEDNPDDKSIGNGSCEASGMSQIAVEETFATPLTVAKPAASFDLSMVSVMAAASSDEGSIQGEPDWMDCEQFHV